MVNYHEILNNSNQREKPFDKQNMVENNAGGFDSAVPKLISEFSNRNM